MNFIISAIAVASVATLGSVMALQPAAQLPSEPMSKTPTELRSGKIVTSPGKASAAISMTHRLVGDVAVGQPLVLEMLFSARQQGAMQLEIRPDDALSGQELQLNGIERGKTLQVNLLPLSEGRHYVKIFARINDGKSAQTKVFSVPVQVGKGVAKSVAHKASKTPNGELLVRMPSK